MVRFWNLCDVPIRASQICFVNFRVGEGPARPRPLPQTLPSKQTPYVWQEREVLYLCVRHCHAEGERWLPGSEPGSGLTLGMSSQDKSSICGMKMAILNRVCERGMRSTSRAHQNEAIVNLYEVLLPFTFLRLRVVLCVTYLRHTQLYLGLSC